MSKAPGIIDYRGAVLFVALLSLLFTTCLAAAAPAVSKGDEEKGKAIVAKVNDKPIYEDQLKPFVEAALKKYEKSGRGAPAPDARQQMRKQALDKVVAQELLDQASAGMKISDIEEKIDEKVKALKQGYSSEEEFAKYLKAKGQTTKDLRDSFRRHIYLDEYLSKRGVTDPEVSEAEIEKYYDENRKSFQRKETIKVSHILVKVDKDATPEERKEKRNKIQEIRRKVVEGKEFSEAAKEYSECGSGPGGGDLGYINRGYMPKEFDIVAFGLQKDELSEVVETKFGYHLIRVDDKRPEGMVPLDDLKDFIAKYLKQNLSQIKMRALIEKLRDRAKIEVFLDTQ